MNSFDDSCNINEASIDVGSKQMNNNLQKLKEKLDVLLLDLPLDSQEALFLSREIDILIIEYYRKQENTQ